MYTLGDAEFRYITKEIYRYASINLTEKKRSLIISRLSKRIRALGLNSFKEYVRYLKESDQDKSEFQHMVNALTTNYSLFFRESHHFDYLTGTILPSQQNRQVNIWSAASSTGQEIYSILISLLEYQKTSGKNYLYKFFASDISSDVLRYAVKGIYPKRDIENVAPDLLSEYFLKGGKGNEEYVKFKNKYIKMVHFFKLNLSDPVYSLPKMDVIFLRNVIIYFDKETKMELITKLYDYLQPGGYLFLGHSESLTGISDKFHPVGKTIYRRSDNA